MMHLSHALQIQPGDVVVLIGSGDKTTALFRLGRELREAGRRVLLTATSSLAADLQTASIPSLTFDPNSQSSSDIIPQLRNALDQASQVLLIGKSDAMSGVPPEVIDALAEIGLFDVIVCKTDLQRDTIQEMLDTTSVVPASTSLVVPVVSLAALNRPLTVEDLSRPTLGTPVSARIIPLLNQLDQAEAVLSRQLARRLLNWERIRAVAVGSVDRDQGIAWVENRVAAVVLAAGQASRFGSAKQLALWQGKPLLAHGVDAVLASQAGPVVVVLGAYADACRQVLADRPVQIVMNEQFAAGQSTSMKAGLAALPETISAAIFPLADQPFVTPAVIDAVIAAYRRSLKPVVWPEYEGRRGNPVLFDRRLFPEMNQISGDVGAKPVLIAHQAEAERVAVAERAILQDIDRPEDL